ncbi:MAG: RNA methyltransferase [Candidatus Peregrinibacteria bacterium]|nr:RNA methyltransferase [Candidatus Peregrinibacteria bacterium]
MEVKNITSAQNQIIKDVVKLATSSKARREEGLVILDGVHLCEEYLKTQDNASFEMLFFAERFSQNSEFSQFKNQENLIEIADSLMTKISPSKSPIGILGVAKIDKPEPLENSFILICENIQDPGNLGTIIRSGASFGVDAIFCENCADAFSPKVLRASMGGVFYTKIFENIGLEEIRKNFDGQILGATLKDNSENIFTTNLPERVAFLVGNEGAGITPEAEKICDGFVKIPMTNNFESLNVAVATSILCAEKSRGK